MEHDRTESQLLVVLIQSAPPPEGTHVIDDGTDDTLSTSAVAVIVDIAGLGWRVLSVNEVEGFTEAARGRISVRVGPCSVIGQIRRGGVADDFLRPALGSRAHEICCDIRNCLVA